MIAYNLVLFVHIVSALALGGANAIVIAGVIQARRARTVPQLRLWLGLLRSTGRLPQISGLLLIASGLYMGLTAWGFQTAWIDVALVAVVIMAMIPARILVPRMKAIGTGMSEATGETIPANLREKVMNTGLWTGVLTNNALFLGMVFLMTVKPNLIGSLATIIVAILAGIVLSIIWRQTGATTAETPVRPMQATKSLQ